MKAPGLYWRIELLNLKKKPLMDGNKPINNIIEYLIAQYFNMFMWKI